VTALPELAGLGVSVLVVSFGQREGARRWAEETKCPFPVLLDPHRKIYQAFGLYRSVFKVWSISCLVYYAEQISTGRELPKPFENIHDDPQQMGGDFLLSADGTVNFTHPSQAANDRPSIGQIINAVQTCVQQPLSFPNKSEGPSKA